MQNLAADDGFFDAKNKKKRRTMEMRSSSLGNLNDMKREDSNSNANQSDKVSYKNMKADS